MATRVSRCALPDSGNPHRQPAGYDVNSIPGLAELWSQMRGDARVTVAVLDGPVDRSHPSLRLANLATLETLVPSVADGGPASRHGTHVASVILGQPEGPVQGIAPGCRGLVAPIFESVGDSSFRPCSQLDLARAIAEAVRHGAHVINISGGEFSPSESAAPLLAETVQRCACRDVLIVAAAGNQGCACLHLPAALPCVLAVGAMDAAGEPLPLSNWGDVYEQQGILAPGEHILGAGPGGGVTLGTGTSYAAAIVSGIAALLLSLQRKLGQKPSPRLVRQILLRSARGCAEQPTTDCRRLLAGRLNVQGAVSLLTQGDCTMSEATVTSAADSSSPPATAPAAQTSIEWPRPGAVQPSACACALGSGGPRSVYALGRIGYDLISEARLDSVVQHIAAHRKEAPDRGLAFDPQKVLDYLRNNSFGASSLEWTLVVDGTPVYAIRPQGPFAGESYERLQEFLNDQLSGAVDRVSVAGVLAGQATLLLGQVLPVIVPELRGMYSWRTAALTEAVIGPPPPPRAPQARRQAYELKRAGVQNFLERVYHELRNLGVLPQERAVNFAATNAFQIGEIYESALKEKMELDSIKASPSPFCRPGSDCWDLEVHFFYPERQVQTVRKVYRFTVDVNDVVPVTIGPVRSWYTR
jgi:hypothetical protein